eukprot:Nk52_evm5s1315 gene=Nk52_evmTU5s1315
MNGKSKSEVLPFIGAGEELLARVQTRHRGEEGIMFVTRKKVVWCAIRDGKLDVDNPKLKISYPEIKLQKVNPDSKPKLQMQLVFHQEERPPAGFHFNGKDALKDRTKVKECFQQLIIKNQKLQPPGAEGGSASSSRPATPAAILLAEANVPEELKKRARVLAQDADLRQVYNDIVTKGPISEEEFWNTRRNLLDSGKGNTGGGFVNESDGSQFELKQGVSSAFLADVRPELDNGCNNFKYVLTAAVIRSIFVTHPAVKRLYELYVPDKMSEKEFWRKYFESRTFNKYRTQAAGGKPATTKGGKRGNDDIFAHCADGDDDYDKLKQRRVQDTLVDLTLSADNSLEGHSGSRGRSGYGQLCETDTREGDIATRLETVGKGKNAPVKVRDESHVLQIFNRHSTLVLNSLNDKVGPPTSEQLKKSGKEKVKLNEQQSTKDKGEGETPTNGIVNVDVFKDAVIYDDLVGESDSPYMSLNINDAHAYMQNLSGLKTGVAGGTIGKRKLSKDDEAAAEERRKGMKRFCASLDAWSPKLYQSATGSGGIEPESGLECLNDVSLSVIKYLAGKCNAAGQSGLHGKPQSLDPPVEVLPDSSRKLLIRYTFAVEELLRHYWARGNLSNGLPGKPSETKAKMERVRAKLAEWKTLIEGERNKFEMEETKKYFDTLINSIEAVLRVPLARGPPTRPGTPAGGVPARPTVKGSNKSTA